METQIKRYTEIKAKPIDCIKFTEKGIEFMKSGIYSVRTFNADGSTREERFRVVERDEYFEIRKMKPTRKKPCPS